MIDRAEFKSRGFMALVTVVVIGAAALIMSLNSSLLGLGALDFGYFAAQGGGAAALADGCLEEALRQLRVNSAYSGESNLSLLDGSCIIEVTDLGGGSRAILVTARRGDFTKRLAVTAFWANRAVSLGDWREL